VSKTKHLALTLTLVATAQSALAQPAPPSPPQPQPAAASDDKKAEAKALYEQGLSHYNLGEFDQAIDAFRKSYAISQAPGLLFNIAQSFRLKKDYEQATYFYQTYLRLKPDAPNRADVEERLKEMQDALEEQKKLGNKPPIGTVSPDGGTTTTTTTTPTGTTTTTTTTPEKPVPTGETGVRSTSLITAGYATGGAGIALVATGFVFGKLAKNAERDLNKLNNGGTWTQAQQDRYDAGKRNNTIATISFIAGGAALVTGATLFVLGTMKKSSTEVAIMPTAHGTSVAVGWSF
jgi:tetratricopeptide (TPR) repeat protein